MRKMNDEVLDLSDLMADHAETMAKSEDSVSSSELEFDDELEQFLNDTQEEINLLPEEPIDEKPILPFLFMDRVTVQEIDVYNKGGLFVRKPEGGQPDKEMQLCVCLDGEFVVLGWVKVSLRTFLLIKKLCSTRKLFIRADDNLEEEITMEHLSSSYLLEAI